MMIDDPHETSRPPGAPGSERTPIDWLGATRATATLVQWLALALVVAVAVIAATPRSPVRLDVSTASLLGLDQVGGITTQVDVASSGRLTLSFTNPSFGERMLNLLTTVPGLLLVAEIARRFATLLRAAQQHDPFTAATARQLATIARITALGGLGVWAVASIARWELSSRVLSSGRDSSLLQQSPAGWLGAALIVAGFGQLVKRGVSMRTELDAVI